MRRFGDWLVGRFFVFLSGSGEPEVIGDDGNLGCPMVYRWTLLDWGWCKVLAHHFAPDTIDVYPHYYSRPFVTLVLTGEYIDIDEGGEEPEWELMSRAAVAYRPARYMHRIQVSSGGAWSIVFMGPTVRSPAADKPKPPSHDYRAYQMSRRYKGTHPPIY